MSATIEQVEEKLEALSGYQSLLTELKKTRDDLYRHSTLKEFDDQIANAESKSAAIRKALRAQLEEYAVTNGKLDHPDITWRTHSKKQYDPDKALAWCIEHEPQCVAQSLKKKEFNKVVDTYGFQTSDVEIQKRLIPAIPQDFGERKIRRELYLKEQESND